MLAYLPPPANGNYRFLLWEVIFGRPSVSIWTPLQPEWQFERFLLWEPILGKAGVGRWTPNPMVILEIPALRAHISRPGVGIWPPHKFLQWCFILQVKAVSLHIAGRYVYFNRLGYDSWSLYGRQMEHAIGSFKNSYNGTSYGRQMDCTPFPNSNFRNYYNGTSYCRQFTEPKTKALVFLDN